MKEEDSFTLVDKIFNQQKSNLSGIELIENEIQRKIKKHGYDAEFIQSNPQYYADKQLSTAAEMLLASDHEENIKQHCFPTNWPIDEVDKMLSRDYKQRLIIAGAFIVDELNRINQVS